MNIFFQVSQLYCSSASAKLYGIVCQVEHQSNIVAHTYLILTTSFWHWFTFKHQNKSSDSASHWEKSCFKLEKPVLYTKWASVLPWCVQKVIQCATIMVTSLFTHIVRSEEKNCTCRKMHNKDKKKKNIVKKKKSKKRKKIFKKLLQLIHCRIFNYFYYEARFWH